MNKEKRTIFLSEQILTYTLDRGKRKNTYLCISQGELIVKAPLGLSLKKVESIIIAKQKWILDKLSHTAIIQADSSFKNGSEIFIFGKPYIIEEIHIQGKNSAHLQDDRLVVYISKGKVKTITEDFLSNLLNDTLSGIFSEFQRITGLSPKSFKSKKLSKSWGRCSSDGNISISRKLVHYPCEAIEYVVLHELCHLKFMNHSKDFWNLVNSYMPDYLKRRNMLR